MDENTKKAIDGTFQKAVSEIRGEFEGKFITPDELKKALENARKPENEPVDDWKDEKAFWSDLVLGKTAGDLDTAANSATIVPTVISKKIHELLYQMDWVRPLVTVIADDKGTIPVEATGFTAYRTAENTEPNSGTVTTLTYTAVSYDTYDVAADTLLSNKLLMNAEPDIMGYIYSNLANKFAVLEKNEFITGDNSTELYGLNIGVTGAALTMQTAASATTIATIEYDDLVTVFYGLAEQYRRNATWLMDPLTLAAIRKIKDINGIPLMSPTEQTLFGKPVIEADDMSSTGTTNGVIYFGDFKNGYMLFDKGGMEVVATKEGQTLASKRATYIIAVKRTDGKIVNAAAITGLKLHA